MNTWERRTQLLRGEEFQHRPRRKTPSFSSSLLDAIYRSIEDEEAACDSVLYRQSTTPATRTKKQRNNALEDEAALRRAIMIEKWMGNEKNCRRSHGGSRSSRLNNSASSSSDSSCGKVFSSSESETSYGLGSKSVQGRKQIRTAVWEQSGWDQTPKREGALMRTKSRALKIYGDLKKVKQPISPGRRLTNFLNSLFNSRNAKREETVQKSRSVKDSSTFSTSSRSCLSKPPSSRAKLGCLGSNDGSTKRSVRFYPVTVILDEDCRPCGHKCVYEDDPSLMPAAPVVQKVAGTAILKNASSQMKDFGDDDGDDDDMESCTSSDLFELDNIGAGGVGTYREELPVYGTTSLETHLRIAKGLIVN